MTYLYVRHVSSLYQYICRSYDMNSECVIYRYVKHDIMSEHASLLLTYIYDLCDRLSHVQLVANTSIYM